MTGIKTLDIDQTACEYAFFIIAGTTYIRVWVGDFQSKSINEIYECEKVGDLYKKGLILRKCLKQIFGVFIYTIFVHWHNRDIAY